jgi:hypothetical protein
MLKGTAFRPYITNLDSVQSSFSAACKGQDRGATEAVLRDGTACSLARQCRYGGASTHLAALRLAAENCASGTGDARNKYPKSLAGSLLSLYCTS